MIQSVMLVLDKFIPVWGLPFDFIPRFRRTLWHREEIDDIEVLDSMVTPGDAP
jgi:hypothetical protein